MLNELLLCARLCAEHVTGFIIFKRHKDTMRPCLQAGGDRSTMELSLWLEGMWPAGSRLGIRTQTDGCQSLGGSLVATRAPVCVSACACTQLPSPNTAPLLLCLQLLSLELIPELTS